QFTVTLSEESATATVVYYEVTGSAEGGSDYTALSGTVTVPAYTLSVPINVAVMDDLTLEGTETVVVTITGTDNASIIVGASSSATVNINDNDSAAVTVGDVSITEGGDLVFTVTLNNAVAGGFDVNVSFTDDTASGVYFEDYDSTGVPLSFTGTAGESKTVTVWTNPDGLIETDETFTVNLSSANTLVDVSDTATGTIINDDTATVSLTATADAAEPSTNGQFTVNLSGGVSDRFTTVTYSVNGTATPGADYTALSGSLMIPPYTPFVTIDVSVLDDLISNEGTETVSVTLTGTNDTAITIVLPDSATVNITDND
ncbi:hypothetical protein C4544_05145, partial [candidate division WS5 bacterium]